MVRLVVCVVGSRLIGSRIVQKYDIISVFTSRARFYGHFIEKSVERISVVVE